MSGTRRTAQRRMASVGRRIGDQLRIAANLVRWALLGAVSGALAGLGSWCFLEVLDRITNLRTGNDWIVWLMPAGGLILGGVYHYVGGRASRGSTLLLEQIHEPTDWVPRRMAPLIVLGTWGSHLVGASVGREGTALQMSGSLTDSFARLIRLRDDDRRTLLIAALAGGFGAVFGVPVAGAIFALEVQSIGRVRYEAIVPALTASVVGDRIVRALGYEHTIRLQLDPRIDTWLLLKIALAGVCFGLAGAAFIEITDGLRHVMSRVVSWPPLRPAIGGLASIGLIALVGRDYTAMSLPIIDRALAGDSLSFAVFALKIVFTAIAIGTYFPGGEVTPLFAIGATLGAALAAPLNVSGPLIAAVGFIAVFAGASNTPIACTVMGMELFGGAAALPFAAACIVSYVFAGHRSIYSTQRLAVDKAGRRLDLRVAVHDWWAHTTHPHRRNR